MAVWLILLCCWLACSCSFVAGAWWASVTAERHEGHECPPAARESADDRIAARWLHVVEQRDRYGPRRTGDR